MKFSLVSLATAAAIQQYAAKIDPTISDGAKGVFVMTYDSEQAVGATYSLRLELEDFTVSDIIFS